MSFKGAFLSLICGVSLSMLVACGSAHAGEDVTQRKIVDIGCHNTDNTCYVTLDGSPFGSSLGCGGATNEFRFDNGNTDYGKRSYASLLSAFLSGKPIMAYVDGCLQYRPKLQYFRIQ